VSSVKMHAIVSRMNGIMELMKSIFFWFHIEIL
jgi:hypothetical protein